MNHLLSFVLFCFIFRLSPILTLMPLMLDFLRPAYDSRIFCGFRSRWMIPLLLRMRMAAAICCRNTLNVSSLRVPLAGEKKKDKIQIQITKRNVCGHPENLSSQLDGGRFVVLKYPRPSAPLSGV